MTLKDFNSEYILSEHERFDLRGFRRRLVGTAMLKVLYTSLLRPSGCSARPLQGGNAGFLTLGKFGAHRHDIT